MGARKGYSFESVPGVRVSSVSINTEDTEVTPTAAQVSSQGG